MFSKGVILIFLILGLSSSIAHAIPHQNRAQDPCTDNHTGKNNSVLVKGDDKTTPKNGKTTDGKKTQSQLTDNKKDQTKNDTLVGDNGKNDTSAGDNGKNNTSTGGTGTDAQTSLTLDQSVINLGSKSDGLNNATTGTSASLTSTNNFINFCLGKQITNGQQIKNGSCNPIPMGDIASTDNMPSCKYVSPKNLDTLKSNTSFTMTLAVKNIQLGVFTNPETNYYAAPQQINKQGNIIGHTHLLIEQVDSLTSTTPTTPTKFAFFKGIDGPAGTDGTVSADVTTGLPPGVYRFGTITTTANHVPVLAAVAQHGTFEDAIYVTVTQDGNPDTGNGGKNDTNSNTGTGNNTTNPNNKKNGKTTNTTTTNSKAVEKSSAASTKKFSLDYRKD